MTALTVTSPDGTRIHAQRFGTGRPLVVVSGALFASERWLRVVPLISTERCLVVMDRRGRGQSESSGPYSPEREIEDVLAVLAADEGPCDLFGHSSGAILALQAAQRTPPNLERLILYEPPVFFAHEDQIAADLPERLEALLAAGQTEAAVETFLREGPRASEEELSNLKAGPTWTRLVRDFAHTVPYDSHVQRGFSLDPEALARVRFRTLMLFGSASPARMRAATEIISGRLPNACVVALAGQQHVAMLTAPAVFASAINEFLAAPPPPS